MTLAQAQDKVQGVWSGGCKRSMEMGGGIFVLVALTLWQMV